MGYFIFMGYLCHSDTVTFWHTYSYCLWVMLQAWVMDGLPMGLSWVFDGLFMGYFLTVFLSHFWYAFCDTLSQILYVFCDTFLYPFGSTYTEFCGLLALFGYNFLRTVTDRV